MTGLCFRESNEGDLLTFRKLCGVWFLSDDKGYKRFLLDEGGATTDPFRYGMFLILPGTDLLSFNGRISPSSSFCSILELTFAELSLAFLTEGVLNCFISNLRF